METDVTFDRLLLDATDLLFQNDLNKARAKLNKALARHPNEPRALSLLANIMSAQQDYAGSVAIYRQLLGLFPDEPILHFKLGCEYLHMGELKPGIDEIDKAAMLDPETEKWKYFSDEINYMLGILKTKPENQVDLEPELVELLGKVSEFVKEHPAEEEIPPDPEDSQYSKNREDSQSRISINDFKAEAAAEETDISQETEPEEEPPPEDLPVITVDINPVEELVFSPQLIKFPLDRIWYIREKTVLCVDSETESTPAFERFRGTVTENYIENDKTGRLMEFSPSGTMILVPSSGKYFLGFTIQNSPLYIREELVVAFQGQLKWENGWLRGEHIKIPMMSFRGDGTVFIELTDKLFNIELPDENFITAPIARLVGWDGYIVAQCNDDRSVQVAGAGHLMLRS